MILIILAIVIELAVIALSVGANARFRSESCLPMQWSLSGSVNWSAPRLVALAFMPVVFGGVFVFYVVSARMGRVRPGQEGLIVPMLILIGGGFIAVQLFHFWMIDRTLRRKR
jgi:hypothetical protein